MKAYRLQSFTGLGALTTTEEPEPVASPGEVLIRVRAVSLNYRDLAMARDAYPPQHLPGLIPVSDASGEVVAVGEGTSALSVGDRVVSTFHPRWFGGDQPHDQGRDQFGSHRDGWLAEYKAMNQESVVRFPGHLSFEEAATLPCAALTAWTALRAGNPVRPGQTVMTLGTGGVSLFAVQLAKLLGAKVVATTSTDEKADVLRKLGADHVINYSRTSAWGEEARAWSGGHGVDRVIEVGGSGTFAQSMKAVAPAGEVAVIGFVASSKISTLDFNDFFLSGATFRIVNVGDRAALLDLLTAVAHSQLRPVIDSVHTFESTIAAYERLESGRAVGKVVISI